MSASEPVESPGQADADDGFAYHGSFEHLPESPAELPRQRRAYERQATTCDLCGEGGTERRVLAVPGPTSGQTIALKRWWALCAPCRVALREGDRSTVTLRGGVENRRNFELIITTLANAEGDW